MPLYNYSEVFVPAKQISKHYSQSLDVKKTEPNAHCALVYFWSHVHELSLLFQAIHLSAQYNNNNNTDNNNNNNNTDNNWPLYQLQPYGSFILTLLCPSHLLISFVFKTPLGK